MMARKRKDTDLASSELPADYPAFLESLKNRVRQAQTKAMLSVNRELIQLYWDIGRDIVERQDREGWGKNVVDRIAGDMQKAFPGLQGFSPVNVWRMRAFYLAYRRDPAILSQAVTELEPGPAAVGRSRHSLGSQSNAVVQAKGPGPTTVVRGEDGRTRLEPGGAHRTNRKRSVWTPRKGDQQFRPDASPSPIRSGSTIVERSVPIRLPDLARRRS